MNHDAFRTIWELPELPYSHSKKVGESQNRPGDRLCPSDLPYSMKPTTVITIHNANTLLYGTTIVIPSHSKNAMNLLFGNIEGDFIVLRFSVLYISLMP